MKFDNCFHPKPLGKRPFVVHLPNDEPLVVGKGHRERLCDVSMTEGSGRMATPSS